jgi:hypothetical protein
MTIVVYRINQLRTIWAEDVVTLRKNARRRGCCSLSCLLQTSNQSGQIDGISQSFAAFCVRVKMITTIVVRQQTRLIGRESDD